MELTAQAQVSLYICTALLLISYAVVWMWLGIMYGAPIMMVFLLMVSPMIVLLLYDLNCTVYGNCVLWAWVKTTLTVFYVVVTMLMLSWKN